MSLEVSYIHHSQVWKYLGLRRQTLPSEVWAAMCPAFSHSSVGRYRLVWVHCRWLWLLWNNNLNNVHSPDTVFFSHLFYPQLLKYLWTVRPSDIEHLTIMSWLIMTLRNTWSLIHYKKETILKYLQYDRIGLEICLLAGFVLIYFPFIWMREIPNS